MYETRANPTEEEIPKDSIEIKQKFKTTVKIGNNRFDSRREKK